MGGRRQLLQKVWIQLTAHRGQFPYDKHLGSELYQNAGREGKYGQKVLEAIKTALEPLSEIKVYDVSMTKDVITVWIQTEYGNDSVQIVPKGGD